MNTRTNRRAFSGLRRLRKRAGLTLHEIANMSKLAVSTVWAVEKGHVDLKDYRRRMRLLAVMARLRKLGAK